MLPEKLQQRELWVTLAGVAVTALAPRLGLSEEQLYTLGAMVVGYATSRGVAKMKGGG